VVASVSTGREEDDGEEEIAQSASYGLHRIPLFALPTPYYRVYE
jgi:hypothetical protein